MLLKSVKYPWQTISRNIAQNKINISDILARLYEWHECLKYSMTFFVNIATDIGFNDDVVYVSDAIKRHDQHPSVKRIR